MKRREMVGKWATSKIKDVLSSLVMVILRGMLAEAFFMIINKKKIKKLRGKMRVNIEMTKNDGESEPKSSRFRARVPMSVGDYSKLA